MTTQIVIMAIPLKTSVPSIEEKFIFNCRTINRYWNIYNIFTPWTTMSKRPYTDF